MRELSGGESVSIAVVPLRVSVTGVGADSGVVLRVYEGGVQAQVPRQSPIEAVIPPTPRTVTLMVEAADGGLIPPDTRVGVALRADAGPNPDHLVISAVDVGAKRSVEFAQIVVGSTITVTVPSILGGGGQNPDPTNGGLGWRAAGTYAFREAFASTTPASSLPWVLALDGSVSMVTRLARPEVADLVVMVGAVTQEWMNRQPKGCVVTSAGGIVPVAVSSDYPEGAIGAARSSDAPPSWLHLAPAISQAAEQLRSGGTLVAVLGGVPSDLAATRAAIERHPQLDVRLVVWGSSAWGLRADERPEWFADDLAALSDLQDLATIVAVGDATVSTRAVPLAAALAAERSVRAVP